MSDIATDVNCIMALFKQAAVDHSSSKGKPDIPDYMYHALSVLLTNVFERQDNAMQEMRDEFQKRT